MLFADSIVVAVMLGLSLVISLDSGPIRRISYALACRRRHRRTSGSRSAESRAGQKTADRHAAASPNPSGHEPPRTSYCEHTPELSTLRRTRS